MGEWSGIEARRSLRARSSGPARSIAGQRDGGDGELDRFVADHYDRLLGLARYRSGDLQVAEDLAQEALVKLVTNWDQVRYMDRPWSWLAVVVLNLSTNRLRRLKVARRAQALLGHRVEVDIHSDDQELVAVLETVRLLPERQQTALLLRHYARLSVRETAEAMDCAEGTVKSLTYHATQEMRRLLALGGET